MTFIDDSGNVLQFDGDFAITKQAVSFLTGSIKGDVSITFSIDNNSTNRKILGYGGPNAASQAFISKQTFTRVRNGNVIDRGYIVIQSEDSDILKCFYISGNSNWIQILSGLITSLDYLGNGIGKNYSVKLDFSTQVNARIGQNYGIVFPFVDWYMGLNRGYITNNSGNLNSVNIGNSKTALYDSSHDAINYPLNDLYPCFFISSLIDEIAAQNGIKIDGNLLNDSLFNSVVVTPGNGFMRRAQGPIINITGATQSIPSSTNNPYISFGLVIDSTGLFNSSTGRYTPNTRTGYKVTLNVITGSPTGSFTINVRSGSGTNFGAISGGETGDSKIFSVTVELGDYFYVTVSNSAAAQNVKIDLVIQEKTGVGYNEYVNPSNFLPPISCFDILKSIINNFGCNAYFNDASKTLSINIIDKIKLEDSLDWSAYYKSHQTDYITDKAQNNYIVHKQNNVDVSINKYNDLNKTNYGDGNIETDFNLKSDNNIIELSSSPSSFAISTSRTYVSNIPLVTLADDSVNYTYSSISSGGTGISRFVTGDSSPFQQGEIVRIINSANVDLGYFRVEAISNGTEVPIEFTFRATDTGTIRKQKITFNDVGLRFLTVKSNISIKELLPLMTYANGDTMITNIDYAVYSKQMTGLNSIDQWKNNLSIDNPDIEGFSDPTLKEIYFNKIKRFVGAPNIRCTMTIPESIYQAYSFDRFIYLKTKDLTGYFYINNFENYVDGNTPVILNLYML
jgi:hypothetical protein